MCSCSFRHTSYTLVVPPWFWQTGEHKQTSGCSQCLCQSHAVRAAQTYCKKYRPVVAVKVLQILVCGRNVVAIQNVCCDQKPVLTLTYICMRRCLRTHWWALSKEDTIHLIILFSLLYFVISKFNLKKIIFF